VKLPSIIARWLSLLSFALGSLGRRRSKFIASLVGLALVSAAFASVFSLTDALRAESRRVLQTLPDITVSRLRAGRPSTVALSEIEPLRAIAGVGAVRARAWGYLYLDAIAANVVVVGLSDDQRAALERAGVDGSLSGRDARGWVLLGDAVARAFGARPGDELDLAGRTFRVRAIARERTSIVTADVIAMDPSDARAILALTESEATDIAVHVYNPDEVATVSARISEAMPGARVVTRDELARVYELTWSARGGFVALALIPALVALLVLAWDRMTGLSADERREVATLKAVGWSTRDVLVVRVIESSVIGVFATALGAILAHVYVFVLGAPGLFSAMRGWSVLAPAIRPVPSGDGASVLAIVALTILPWIAASIVPAWRAAVIDPAESLR
jgi:ABC-type lipoprotein release transport system permease subunit